MHTEVMILIIKSVIKQFEVVLMSYVPRAVVFNVKLIATFDIRVTFMQFLPAVFYTVLFLTEESTVFYIEVCS